MRFACTMKNAATVTTQKTSPYWLKTKNITLKFDIREGVEGILTHTPITQIIKIKLRTGKFSFNLYIIFRNIRSSLI